MQENKTDAPSELTSLDGTVIYQPLISNLDRMLNVIPTKDKVHKLALSTLVEQCDLEKLSTALTRIKEGIDSSIDEGAFSCIISNDILEDLFTANNEEAFDDTLVLAVVKILRELGYKVKYMELIYSDISNLLEISW